MKPLLASAFDPKHPLRFPVLASPKLDGMRVLIKDGVALSRSLKPIPNRHVQFLLSNPKFNGFDGEVVVGSATDFNVMQATTSGLTSHEDAPDFTYYVFDLWDKGQFPFWSRLDLLLSLDIKFNYIKVLEQVLIHNMEELQEFEARCLTNGYEGVMVRDPSGLYKFGRSTPKEGILLKIKKFEDAEAVVLGVEERMHNENEAKTNALGRTERSTSKEGLVPAGDLGALVCQTTEGVVFRIGTGFSAEQRLDFWRDREKLVGKLVKYKFFPSGVKEAPRFPVFLGFRSHIDL